MSIWLDDLSRERIETGNLAELIEQKHVVGVTTNPTIFAAAIANGERYDEQVAQLVDKGEPVDRVVFELTTEDVRNACDIFAPLAGEESADGRVSIEVEPTLANDTEGTIASAQALWAAVDRSNVLIKIPATKEGLPAITAAIAEGISVNVTLIFGKVRYQEVMDAYLSGLEAARDAGLDLSRDPVGRVVLRVPGGHRDRRPAGEDRDRRGRWRCAARPPSPTPGSPTRRTRRSSPATAGSELERGRRQPAAPAVGVDRRQEPGLLRHPLRHRPRRRRTRSTRCRRRPWTRSPTTVRSTGDQVTGKAGEAQAVFDQLAAVGIDFEDVLVVLETEGVDKFKKSWVELVETVKGQMAAAGK